MMNTSEGLSATVSKKETSVFYNTLSILLKAVVGRNTVVDLQNESMVVGLVDHVDGYMNVSMKDCTFTDPRGNIRPYDWFFIQARKIRYVHIPPEIRIIPAMKEQLRLLRERPGDEKPKRTFKTKRAEERQREGVAALEKIMQERNKTQSKS